MITAVIEGQRLKVYEVDPSADPRWEAFVRSHRDGSIYHHPAWISVLQEEYGQKAGHLICEDTCGEIQAVLPLFYTRGVPFLSGQLLIAPRLSSLPRTPLGGPLSKSADATITILKAAIDRTTSDPKRYLQIKTQGPELDGLIDGIVAVPWRLSYILRLPDRSAGPFRIQNSHNRGNVRWAVQKAVNHGVTVKAADTEAELGEWYLLYQQTMRRNAVPARSYQFFLSMWCELNQRNLMRLLLAVRTEGSCSRPLAGAIFLTLGRTISYAFNGSDERGLALGANDLIQWSAINQAHDEGFELFDFGEVPDGKPGLAKFKSKWGSDPIRLYRYYYPGAAGLQAQANGWGARVVSIGKLIWRYVPLPATAWLSNRIYEKLSISVSLLSLCDRAADVLLFF